MSYNKRFAAFAAKTNQTVVGVGRIFLTDSIVVFTLVTIRTVIVV